MMRSLSPALRALVHRNALLALILVAGSSLATSTAGCGGSDTTSSPTETDAGDGGTTTKPDSGGGTDSGTEVDSGGGTDSGKDSSTTDSGTDAADDGATDAATDASDGAALPTLSVDDVSIDEGASGTATLTFTVTLAGSSTETVTVDYATTDGTATVAGSDYAAGTGTVTFAPGDTSKTISITINGDAVNEADETFTLTLSNPTNATITRPAATGTITNDDAVPSISIDSPTVVEGNSGTTTATFVVSLSAASGQAISVHYVTTDGTATTANSDYTAVADTVLNFAAGETSKNVTVNVTGDTTIESNETFTVDLSMPTNATIATGQGTCTIQNDDGAAQPSISINDQTIGEGNAGTKVMTFTVSLSAASAQTVTVDYTTTNGTATGGPSGDFEATTGTVSFATGETTKSVTVTIKGDVADEDDEDFTVTLSNATNGIILDGTGSGTIVDDDGQPSIAINDVALAEGQAGNSALVFTVTLSAASGKAVTATYTTADGSATTGGTAGTGGQDYTAATGQVVFPPGTTTQDVTVQIAGDTLNEANETFVVNLTAPVNATVGDAQGTGTITNDDALPNIEISDATVTEGNAGTAALVFTVSLVDGSSNPAPSGRQVTVAYASANGSGVAPSDFTAVNGTLTFAAGETSKQITVLANGDTVAEANETFTVNLSSPTNAAITGATGDGTITNDDGALPFLNINDQTITEGNAGTQTMTFTVTLSAASAQTVTVQYATANFTATSGGTLDSGGQDYVATNGTLSFAPGELSKPITVTINGDVADEPNQTFRVNLSSASSNAAIADSVGVGTITDDDATPTLSIANASTAEGNSGTKTLSLNVTLSAKSGRTVTVNYATANISAATTGLLVAGGSDYVATNGTLTFLPGETAKTVNVTINGDTTYEGNNSFSVTLSAPVSATLLDAVGVGTITNDDAIPTMSISDVSQAEGTPAPNTTNITTFFFTVTLSNARSSTITVDFATANGTATAADYTPQVGTLSFAPGETSKTINIAVIKDATTETNQTFFVNLTNVALATLTDSQGIGTILNDD